MLPLEFGTLEFISCDHDNRDYWLAREFMQLKRLTPAQRLPRLVRYMTLCHGAPAPTSAQVPHVPADLAVLPDTPSDHGSGSYYHYDERD